MKNLFSIKIAKIIIFFTTLFSCQKDFLKENVYTQYDVNSFLNTESGLNSVLMAAYSQMRTGFYSNATLFLTNELPGDIMWEWGGGFEAQSVPYMTFNWNSQTSELNGLWNVYYKSISNANTLLDYIDNVTAIPPAKIKGAIAEAKFIRAISYFQLWTLFGSVPIIKTTLEVDLTPSKAAEEELVNFIAESLESASVDLPVKQDLWGKATKGASLALLGRFYLHLHQWQKAADIAKEVMDLSGYALFQGELKNMFAVQNNRNIEMVYALSSSNTVSGGGLPYMAYAFPPAYPVQPNWENFGAQICINNNFYLSYDPIDKRIGWFLTHYRDVGGIEHNLLETNSLGRAVRCFKFVPDPNGKGTDMGNDLPVIRYAEVLLNRSEALNELNGPNEESIDLLNEIRKRAGVVLYNLSDFSTKESLRSAILKERGWEFVGEGLRRMDLIRHGELISMALARGVTNAKDYMIKFPIPQPQIDVNPNLQQNEGY